jgi:hypothetical protein
MKLVRWDPFREFLTVGNRLNRTIDDSFTQRPRPRSVRGSPVDIFERQDHLVIRAEVRASERGHGRSDRERRADPARERKEEKEVRT